MTPALGRRLLAEFTGTYAGIALAAPFIAAQIIGGAIGTLLTVIIHPVPSRTTHSGQPVRLAG
jgi:glycerol uptake facilitator-like aquaporin